MHREEKFTKNLVPAINQSFHWDDDKHFDHLKFQTNSDLLPYISTDKSS